MAEAEKTFSQAEFDVHLSDGILFDFLMYHNYHTFQGFLSIILGIMCFGFYFLSPNPMYPFIGIVILFYMPVSIFMRSKTQMITNPSFKKPLHYIIDEAGLTVSQDGNEEKQKWEDMVKAVSTSKSIIIYTSVVRTSILPKKDMGEGLETAVEIIKKHMPPGKVRIK